MRYRTDLAIECKEEVDTFGGNVFDGVEINETIFDEDIRITKIDIKDNEGEKLFSKKKGTYITIEINGITEGKEGIKERAGKALSGELKKLMPFSPGNKALVIGLGNDMVTPDALGPDTASKVKVTRHFFKMFEFEKDDEMSSVSAFIPGVTGMTGIETADLIRKAVELVNPDFVIIVDSLAARNIERVNTTIQLNNAGISPGSGMGNIRKELNEKTLGRKVIAIGVPTVIDSQTIITDALSEYGIDEKTDLNYVNRKTKDLIVTSTDIDLVIKDFSDIISNGINITLHPGIY